jgi:hypothetical protein
MFVFFYHLYFYQVIHMKKMKKKVPLLVTVLTYAVACILLYFYIIRNNKRYKYIKEYDGM